MSKPSAIERELNIIIVLNNLKDSENLTQIKKKEIEMVDLSGEPTYTLEGQIVPKGGGVEDIKNDLEKVDHQFSIKYRKNETDSDIFEEILNYNDETNFCNLGLRYLNKSILESDFIIFINNGMNDLVYRPMCIAFIKIYKNNYNNNNFLYISTFCSDKRFGQCGTFLMDTIKYVATILNCNEIRLESISKQNTIEFYKKNGFNDIYNTPVEYNHYYLITPEDAVFKPLSAIQGKASLPWYHSMIREDENEGFEEDQFLGGKYKKKRRTKRSNIKTKYTNKKKSNKRSKRMKKI